MRVFGPVVIAFVFPYFLALAEPKLVKISVRTIHASRAVSNEASYARSVSSIPPKFDAGLLDIQSKLATLPYFGFHLLASKEEELCLRKKQTMTLPNGQTIMFRPVHMEDKKLGLWISWHDANDAEILNTRLHFDTGYSVLTGTEESADTGLILAIKAEPIESIQSAAAAPTSE